MKNHTLIIKWATESLISKGYTIQHPIEIVLETPWSNVLRFSTSKGDIYLKQTPAKLSLEYKIIKMLRDQHNASVPKVIDFNNDLKCFLMQDAGVKLRDILCENFNINLLLNAIKEYSCIQNTCISDIEQLLSIGVDDWRISRLPTLYAKLINEKDILLADGISEQELEILNNLFGEVKLTCELIEKYAMPETLNLHDFHDGNILIDKNNNCTMIDWGESEITHPFFSLISCLKNLKFRYKLDDQNLQNLKAAYFENQSYAQIEYLEDVFNLVVKIQPIYRALGFYRVKMCCDPKEFEAWDEGYGCLARPLRELISNFKKESKF